jgi:hypothetical protein
MSHLQMFILCNHVSIMQTNTVLHALLQWLIVIYWVEVTAFTELEAAWAFTKAHHWTRVFNQLNPVLTFTPYFSKINCNIIILIHVNALPEASQPKHFTLTCQKLCHYGIFLMDRLWFNLISSFYFYPQK